MNLRWICRRCNAIKGARLVSDSALFWYRAFRKLSMAMELGSLEPPPLGCTGYEPVLTRLLYIAVNQSRARRA
jgi:hypothetical protein